MYEPRVRILASFVSVLIERGQVGEAVTILQVIARHTEEHSERAPLAAKYRSEIASNGSLELAAALFLSGSKETRTDIGRLFNLISIDAIPHVQNILTGSDNSWKSKQAAEILINMGDQAVSALLSSVESSLINRASLPAVLRVISECIPVGQKDRAVGLLLTLVNDSSKEIRCEVLAGLARIGPAGNFAIFRGKVEDKDVHIRKVALNGIGRSGDRRGGPFLVTLIENAEKSGKEEEQELAATAIEALGALMVSCPAVYDTSLTFLSSLVERYCERSTWKKLMTGSFVRPSCLAYSLTETLGRLRGEPVQKHLAKMSQHHDPVVAKHATELINSRT